jgi:hypothetical protein
MVIYIKKILLFLCFFFLFNTLEVDSNSDKLLFYNKNELYEENYHIIYFYNITSKELKSILNILDIEVLSYIIDNNKYYARNIDELTKIYCKDKNINEQLYYYEYGISIDAISIICTNNELLKLENLASIY